MSVADGFVDIHHHLLPGLDDGSRSMEMSLAMAEAALEDGITHIVCTPHANHHFSFDPETNAERLARVQDAVREQWGERLLLGLGCDFHLMYENIEDAQRHPDKYTINGHRYLLVEFANSAISPNTAQTFYDLALAGMAPIITHPERNPILARQPERMAPWLRAGALIQVTASSLTGRFGPLAERVAHELIERRWAHFLATDAHNTTTRPARMRFAYDAVAERYGEAEATRLCIANPRAAFYGEPLPEQPAPQGLDESAERPRPPARKQGILGRLFGR
jgi:protein-tyrosine phosphatase